MGNIKKMEQIEPENKINYLLPNYQKYRLGRPNEVLSIEYEEEKEKELRIAYIEPGIILEPGSTLSIDNCQYMLKDVELIRDKDLEKIEQVTYIFIPI